MALMKSRVAVNVMHSSYDVEDNEEEEEECHQDHIHHDALENAIDNDKEVEVEVENDLLAKVIDDNMDYVIDDCCNEQEVEVVDFVNVNDDLEDRNANEHLVHS